MLPIVVRAEDLLGDLASFQSAPTAEDGSVLVTFPDDAIQLSVGLRRFWGVVLLTALRDRATSVQYLPWWNKGQLTYIIEGHLRYQHPFPLPPDELAATVIEAARTLFTGPPAPGLLSRFVGRGADRAVCASFTFDVWGYGSVLWDAVCWSNGERAGVELIRVTPLEEVPPV